MELFRAVRVDACWDCKNSNIFVEEPQSPLRQNSPREPIKCWSAKRTARAALPLMSVASADAQSPVVQDMCAREKKLTPSEAELQRSGEARFIPACRPRRKRRVSVGNREIPGGRRVEHHLIIGTGFRRGDHRAHPIAGAERSERLCSDHRARDRRRIARHVHRSGRRLVPSRPGRRPDRRDCRRPVGLVHLEQARGSSRHSRSRRASRPVRRRRTAGSRTWSTTCKVPADHAHGPRAIPTKVATFRRQIRD